MTNPTPERIAVALDIAKAAGVESGEPYRVLCAALGRPRRIAAALALAEAASRLQTTLTEDRSDAMLDAFEEAGKAYRATAPKLRTRAEVDADKLQVIAEWFNNSGRSPVGMANSHLNRLAALCREPLAPEPIIDATPVSMTIDGAYEWSSVSLELWAELAHQCCESDMWANMRPELLAAIQAVQKAAKMQR